ncbi:MAG TPA: VWA domain-containing protein [Candidatus Acetothermia bacterium]|nr:VWA domain-containing protein [Candidatus Acetothermia bacterium]
MKQNCVLARGRPLALFLLAIALLALPAIADGTYLQTQQYVSPQEIYVSGTGSPDTATLSLSVQGMGHAGRFPIDCVFVVDSSATAQLAAAKQFAFDLMETLTDQDRVGVVTFSTMAQLAVPLTSDRLAVKTAIADVVTGGKSAFGDALQIARQALLADGRSDAILVEILLTDGQSNTGRDPGGEGDVASEAGIKIVSVGIGYLIDSNLLEEFAAKTGGLFFKRITSSTIAKIGNLLTVDAAGSDVKVNEVLSSDVRYLGATPSPTRVISNADGTTSLTFNIGKIGLGEQWVGQITLQALRKGTIATDVGSSVSYTSFRGVKDIIAISSGSLSAIVPPAPPSPPIAGFSYSPMNPSTTDTVSFKDQSSDADGQVVAWAWDFGDGATADTASPQHSYSHSGTYMVTLVVTDDDGNTSSSVIQEIVVTNAAPAAMFKVAPEEPRVAVPTVFDASGSYDVDGRLVSYAWDFDGDGVFDVDGASSDIEYTFAETGEANVTLKVTDDEGMSTVVSKTLTVLPSVSAVREIDTCLPDDETITGGTVKVTITITANTQVHGLTVHEDVPDGWTFAEAYNASATFRKETTDWLFMETLEDGDTRVIGYTLTAPATCTERAKAAIGGMVKSSSPHLSRMVLGEDKVALVPTLPINVVISRWDSDQGKINLCLPEQISFDQIQYAVSLWLSGEPVTYTGEKAVTLDDIRDLIAYWLTDTSVHDPLP